MNKTDACTCLIPGRMLHERAGKPSLYPRIADEAWLRGMKFNPRTEGHVLYDPFCGVGGALISPAIIRRSNIAAIFGSDQEQESVDVAERNLALASIAGFESALADHKDPAVAPNGKRVDPRLLELFRSMLLHYGCTEAIHTHIFRHSMPNSVPETIIRPETVSMVITDPPYGHMTSFVEEAGQAASTDQLFGRYVESLRAIRPLLEQGATVTLICDKRQQIDALLSGMSEYDYRESRSSKGQNFRQLHTLQAK